MPPPRAAARVRKGGVVTVSGVPVPEGEEVHVIVVRRGDDWARYLAAPIAAGEFSDAEDPLAWDADGWREVE